MSAHEKCLKPAGDGNPWGLTQAERDVLAAVFSHVSWKEIARHLGVSRTAVNSRLGECFRKMQVRSKVQAAVLWDRWVREKGGAK